jgi:hypothetical protein
MRAPRSASDTASAAERPASSAPQEGFDEIRVPSPDGSVRHFTRAEFEALALPERVALLMGGKMQFFRQGHQVTAREALRGR